ncbi:MAG: hypothetical protein WC683_02930 [bacterium]
MSGVKCIWCGSERVGLTTPDYGFGYGAEYECYDCPIGRNGYRRFSVKSPEARAESRASLALSASNVAAMRRKAGL